LPQVTDVSALDVVPTMATLGCGCANVLRGPTPPAVLF